MARNLVKAGHRVTVFDLNATVMDDLVKDGAKRKATSPLDCIADGVDVIVTMLPATKHVEQTYLDSKAGLFSSKRLQPSTLLIDSSTISPTGSRTLSAHARSLGFTHGLIDAPVSGGVGGAQAGTLTFMVGADQQASLDAATPILSAMGKKIIHCGGSGNGLAAKIANNLMLAVSMAGISEVMHLGTRLGLDAKVLASVINSSSGRCWSSDTYNPVPGVIEGVPASRGYEGGFGVELMRKDVDLALTAAEEQNTDCPLGQLTAQLYKRVSESGYSSKDFSSIFEFYQRNPRLQ